MERRRRGRRKKRRGCSRGPFTNDVSSGDGDVSEKLTWGGGGGGGGILGQILADVICERSLERAGGREEGLKKEW